MIIDTGSALGRGWGLSIFHAANLIYLTDETGKTFVFQASNKYEAIAVNDLCERTLASLMAWDETLVIRTENAIYRFGKT